METKDDPGKAYDKSIRKRLTRTVLIPSITLLVLWAVLATAFFINGLYVRLVAGSVRDVSIPALTALSSLQQERQLALQYLDSPSSGPQQLQQQEQDSDGKLKGLQEAFAATISSAPDEIASKVTALKAQLDQLPVLRSQVNFRSINRAQVNAYYNGVLDSAATLFDTQARIVPDATAVQGAISATSLFRAGDLMSRETSLVSTAFSAAPSPQTTSSSSRSWSATTARSWRRSLRSSNRRCASTTSSSRRATRGNGSTRPRTR